jgi:NAD(P)-dependent dehydrogenase (short-subunit alcohol dehydrogenase family)
MQIDGKVALVTGGASGLGAATVRAITETGGRAVIVDLNDSLGEALTRELGDRAAFARADVSDPGEMQAAVNVARERFGELNILVNCAGASDGFRILGKEGPVALERFSRIIRINLIGTFNAIRLASVLMAENDPNADGERGVIINTASIAAFEGQIGQPAYSASKGGIVGMTLPLARDLARHGIRVVTIAPGIFDTPLLGSLNEEIRLGLSAAVPFPHRLGKPAEYAQLARQVIENAMLNGEVIRLDGALRMAPK